MCDSNATMSGHENRGISYQALLTACLLTALLWGLHCVWFLSDTRPPVWDMALHQTYALNYLQGQMLEPDAPVKLWAMSGNYPPFVHLVIAFVFWILHAGPHIAALANIPATFLLFWATYQLANDFAGSLAARWACILVALVPYLIWISRETILDYWLSALFTASLVFLHRSQGFRSRPWSLLFGLLLGIGMWTKWFFAGLILAPLVYVFMNFRLWKDSDRLTHFFETLLLGGVVAAPWYLPNISRLIRYFGENAGYGAREGEPAVLSFQSLLYYLRLLEGYQLFGILFGILVAGCFFCWRRKLLREGRFLAFSIVGGWLVMTLLRTKDPRFTMPLIGLLMILPGAWIQSWRKTATSLGMKIVLVAVLCIQAYAANFGISRLPKRVVILPGYQGSMRWDWNLYLQDYFGIFGPPRREDWKQNVILQRLADDAQKRAVKSSLALIPDMPWFSEGNFKLYSRMLGMRIPIRHLTSASQGINSFRGCNYVLMTEGNQGMSWTTAASNSLNQIVVNNPGFFHLVDLYRLPNGDTARLYYIELSAR
jgi:4-amino-4-deoxy-L-arabinose transferase-like glycosyltransferase